MAFESQHDMKTDGIAGPGVWQQLLADAGTGTVDTAPYNYVYVSKSLPETATVYSNGAAVYSTRANTGVAAAPTASGHFPVYCRYKVTTMTGTNPDGVEVRGPGHPVGELLQRGRCPARIRARQLRLPTERRMRGDAAGQRRSGLPTHTHRNPGHRLVAAATAGHHEGSRAEGNRGSSLPHGLDALTGVGTEEAEHLQGQRLAEHRCVGDHPLVEDPLRPLHRGATPRASRDGDGERFVEHLRRRARTVSPVRCVRPRGQGRTPRS